MRRFSCDVLMGVFRYCTENDIPADSRAIQMVFCKLVKVYPDLFDKFLFNEEGFSQVLEDDIESLLFGNMLVMLGSKLETLRIDSNLKQEFDENVAYQFSIMQIEKLRKIGNGFLKLLRNNESVRYKKLIKR